MEKGAGKARREKKKEKTAQKTAIRVVVLPIFWEERTDEMQAVLAAAKKVHEMLSEGLGPTVRIVTDNNNKFKPGPRMKHWCALSKSAVQAASVIVTCTWNYSQGQLWHECINLATSLNPSLLSQGNPRGPDPDRDRPSRCSQG